MGKSTSPTDWTALTFPAFLPRVRALLRSVRGAFDLPSILVGVLVVAVMALGVMAVVFGVIPFSQDKAAQQDLAAHRTAQGAARTQDGKFMDSASLASAGYIRQPSNTAFGTDAAGTCYVGVARSGTGRLYFSTDRTQDPQDLNASSVTGCVSWTALQSLVVAVGGTPLVLDATGKSLAVWGNNWSGQLGLGSSGVHPLAPVDLPDLAGKSITAIAGGDETFCAVADGDVYCSGLNAARSQTFSTMTKVPGFSGKTVASLTAGRQSVCAIADGEAYCWGDGTGGRLGSATASSEVPVKVTALAGKTVTELKSGGQHTCAVADGDVYCWGYNFAGQLGNGTTTNSSVAVKVLTGKSVTALSGGDGFFTCAAGSGKTYCWGDNNSGQLGLGDLSNRLTPVEVPSLAGKQVATITTSGVSTCAVVEGAVNCWGDNSLGWLGVGDTGPHTTPAPVPGLAGKTITSLSTYGYFNCAVADSDTYCWGFNGDGQLGQGDTTSLFVPTKVNALAGKRVLALATTTGSVMALIK